VAHLAAGGPVSLGQIPALGDPRLPAQFGDADVGPLGLVYGHRVLLGGHMSEPGQPAEGWVIQALLVAAALPSQVCDLDIVNCTIYPLAEPDSTPDRREGGSLSFVPTPGVAAVGIEVEPPGLRLKNAMHVIETQVDEQDMDDALTAARSRFVLAAAIFALASQPEWGPAFTVHRLRPMGHEDGWRLPPIATNITGIPMSSVDGDGFARIVSLLTLIQRDAPTSQLLALWYAAMEYERRAVEFVDLEHILIRYVKVFERVAKAMVNELRGAVDAVAEKSAVDAELGRLQPVLAGTKSTPNKANLVINVGRAIERIRLNGVGRQLDAAADALGLDEQTRAAGRRAWTARSTKAVHPPDVPSEVTLAELLDAREAAGKYLLGYLTWRSRRLVGPLS